MQLVLFVIRHKETGKYFLRDLMSRSHSGTCTEPRRWQPESKSPPRMFPTKKSAMKFLVEWQKGVHYTDGDGGITIEKPRNPRDRTEMEVIPISIELEPTP